jgi:O-antigen ligase
MGTILALLIVVFLPNYGVEKYGPSPVVPAFFLCLLGIRPVWRERLALFASTAQQRWVVVFLLLLVPVLLSIPGSFSPRMSASIAMVLLLYFFAGVALVRSLRSREQREWLVKWTSIVLMVWIVDALVQYFSGHDLFGVLLTHDGRVLGPFAGTIRLPIYLALLLPVLLMWLMPRGLAVTLTAFGVAAALAMLSGVRAALFFLMVVAAGLFLRLPGGRQKWLVILTLMLMAGMAIALMPTLQERFVRFGTLLEPTFQNLDHLLSYRLTIWDTAANMVRDRPLTGVGAGAFQAAYEHYSTMPGDVFLRDQYRVYHAHQLYVGAIAETGLIGLFALLAILVLCIRWYWTAAPVRRDQAWPYALGLVVYAFPLNSQPVLYQQWLFPVLLLLLAAMLAALENDERGRTKPEQLSSSRD